MVCCIVLKPISHCEKLFLNRQKQKALTDHLESVLRYKPFVFNTTRGTYIFVKKRESYNHIKQILTDFFSQAELDQMKMENTSLRPHFFRKLTKRTLHSREISALGWKRFISSFLMQIDPYNSKSSQNNIVVFETFQNSITNNGSKYQRKYFKRKLKTLRNRVSLGSIEKLIRN